MMGGRAVREKGGPAGQGRGYARKVCIPAGWPWESGLASLVSTPMCYMSLMPGSASWGVRMERRLWVRGLLQTWMKSALGTWELSVIFVILVIAGHAERFDRYYWLSVPRWFSFRKEGWRPRVSTGTRKFLQLGW